MSDYKPVYHQSLEEAVRNDERELWWESFYLNQDCAKDIGSAISAAYDYKSYCLNDCSEPILQKYGFDRVNYVLASTIQNQSYDGRYSWENKAWAREMDLPKEEGFSQFHIDAHPGLINIFTDLVRQAQNESFIQCEDSEVITMGGI